MSILWAHHTEEIMRSAGGYDCVYSEKGSPESRLLFGPSTEGHQLQRLTQNGLNPFLECAAAAEAIATAKRSTWLCSPRILYVEMHIAEIPDDLKKFRNKRSFILVQSSGEDCELLGPCRPYATRICGACSALERNGLCPFLSFQRAEDAAVEVARQSLNRVQIATFRYRNA